MADILQNEKFKRTLLTEFFYANLNDRHAKDANLLYKDFPRFYVGDNYLRIWKRRKKGIVIGRLCTVNQVENERYYLRILLNNVHAPISFDYLLEVNGIVCDSFREAAYKRGLLHNEDDIDKTMEEASIYRMPSELRRLFGTLLHYCKPADPSGLFNKFFDSMAEDFRRLQRHTPMTDEEVLYKILQGINDTLETLGRDVNEFNLVSLKYRPTDQDKYTREFTAEKNIPIPEEDLHAIHKLNIQ